MRYTFAPRVKCLAARDADPEVDAMELGPVGRIRKSVAQRRLAFATTAKGVLLYAARDLGVVPRGLRPGHARRTGIGCGCNVPTIRSNDELSQYAPHDE